jgi:hypothetical protein
MTANSRNNRSEPRSSFRIVPTVTPGRGDQRENPEHTRIGGVLGVRRGSGVRRPKKASILNVRPRSRPADVGCSFRPRL